MFETKQNRNCFLYNLTRLAEGSVLEATSTNSCIHYHSGMTHMYCTTGLMSTGHAARIAHYSKAYRLRAN